MRLLLGFFFILTQLTALGQANNEDFEQFRKKFFFDSAFQRSRVVFPLIKVQGNEEGDDQDTVYVSQRDWTYSDFGYGQGEKGKTDRYKTRLYDNFGRTVAMTLRNTNERIVGFEGIDNGISLHLFFKRTGGLWKLIRIEDLSD